MHLISLRGATTADANTVEAIDQAACELMETLILQNELQESQVVHVLFSATADLTARYPSVVLRERLHWRETAILNVEEKVIQGQLPLCIRVLMTLQSERPKESFRHAYLKGAAALRPDWHSRQDDQRR